MEGKYFTADPKLHIDMLMSQREICMVLINRFKKKFVHAELTKEDREKLLQLNVEYFALTAMIVEKEYEQDGK